MAEWLYEQGIGERRAALIADGDILAARIERDDDGPRLGAILTARMAARSGDVLLDGPGTPRAHLVDPPKGLTEGSALLVEVTRMALRERGRDKVARVRVADPGVVPGDGPNLRERLLAEGDAPIVDLARHGADRLEGAGWTEMLEAARSGRWQVGAAELWIDATPGMTVIDIDGIGDTAALAAAGAIGAARAIVAFDIGGSIAIDFPTLAGREERQRVGDIFDAHLPQPFERTAVNGFGLMQVIRRRTRPSLIEQMQFAPLARDAAALLRQAEWARGTGALTLSARGELLDYIGARPHWVAALERSAGRPIRFEPDATIKGAGHAQ